jgi:hypothetical protein
MTEMQKLMASAVGFDVEVHIVGGFKPCIGKCTGYTQPLDNDPEVAAIEIKIDGLPSLYEITEDEIDTLTIKASKK